MEDSLQAKRPFRPSERNSPLNKGNSHGDRHLGMLLGASVGKSTRAQICALVQKANKLSSFVVLHGCSAAVLYTLKEHYVYGDSLGKNMWAQI